MPSPLVETATWDFPGGLPAPIDGDDDAAATFNPGFQGLADRSQFLQTVVEGFLLGANEISSSDGTHIQISPISMLKIGNAISGIGGVTTYNAAAGLVANACFYLYAFINAGVIAFESNTTPFDPTAPIWKTGALDSRRYIGCFRTDGAGHILPFRAVGAPGARRYFYRYDAAISATATDGVGGGAITVNLGGAVPPHAQAVDLYLTVATNPANLNIAGGTGFITLPVGNVTLPFLLDPSQSFVFGGSGGASTIHAWPFSFTE